ncbi:MAG: [FeFe] hydrogenase H-cluster radical SAM maturase HydG [Candidatus Margulisiibacteriota bacterium]
MFIDHDRIESLIDQTPDRKTVGEILAKSKALKRLSMEEAAVLLSVEDNELLDEILHTAKEVKESIYGKRLVIFAPLYISNLCQNECLYCAFRVSNKDVARKALSQDEILKETEYLLKTGQKRVLLVSGEAYPKEGLDYIIRSIETVYSARDGKNNIRRLNVNLAPLEVSEFKRLKDADIGTYQIFQETYHLPTYKKLHLRGPKADYEYRLTAIDRAFKAGINDVGIGILFGLYDYKFEVLALLAHVEHLEANFGMGPHTISVPRLEPATGSDIAANPPYPVSDKAFKKLIAVLRLAVPYTGLILSTRENAETRRAAFDLGISQISAGSRTNPGGYTEKESVEQFSLGDHRLLDEVIYDICEHGYIPSFCTSCYRLGRTGLDFMEYAKPGEIKKKCLPNALFTFNEYLEDYASPKTKEIGEKLIAREFEALPPDIKEQARILLDRVKKGDRDLFV